MTRTANPKTASTAGNLRDIWPLTPLQHGMLFHSLWERQAGVRPTYQLQFGVGLTATEQYRLPRAEPSHAAAERDDRDQRAESDGAGCDRDDERGVHRRY